MTNGFQLTRIFSPVDPNLGGRLQQGLQLREQFEEGRERKRQSALAGQEQQLPFLVEGARRAKLLKGPERKLELLQRLRGNFERANLSTGILDQGIEQLQAGDLEGFEQSTDQLIALGDQIQGKGAGGIQQAVSVPGVGFAGLTRQGEAQLIQLPEEDQQRVKDALQAEAERKAEAAGLKTRAVQTEKAAKASLIEEEKATGKALGEAKSAPLVAKTRSTIETAVKLASAEATARGETLTDLARSEAALPGLRTAVDQLKELAPIATSTLGARVFDTVVKESGFGSTKGADARVKFISIINNQVLPLLKSTFGAAFTEREGETLKATMGDPNATPAQKIEQLNSFIDQKVRDIQSKQREVGAEVTATEELATGQPLFSSVLNRNVTEADITETLASPDGQGLTREQLLQQLGVQ